jgi:hypothetical protein
MTLHYRCHVCHREASPFLSFQFQTPFFRRFTTLRVHSHASGGAVRVEPKC